MGAAAAATAAVEVVVVVVVLVVVAAGDVTVVPLVLGCGRCQVCVAGEGRIELAVHSTRPGLAVAEVAEVAEGKSNKANTIAADTNPTVDLSTSIDGCGWKEAGCLMAHTYTAAAAAAAAGLVLLKK